MVTAGDDTNNQGAGPREKSSQPDYFKTEMEITRLRVDIKNIFITKKAITPSSERDISPRLLKAHQKLILLKSNYNPRFEMVKVNLTHKVLKDVPGWFDPLSTVLQLYLDVIIIRTKVFSPFFDTSSPISTLSIIGEKEQIRLATYYIDYLFTTISKIIDIVRETHRKKAKAGRKRKRYGSENVSKMVDTRTYASNYRLRIVKSIRDRLNSLLDDIHTDHEIAFMKGLARQERIVDFLSKKYTTKWRYKLLHKSG